MRGGSVFARINLRLEFADARCLCRRPSVAVFSSPRGARAGRLRRGSRRGSQRPPTGHYAGLPRPHNCGVSRPWSGGRELRPGCPVSPLPRPQVTVRSGDQPQSPRGRCGVRLRPARHRGRLGAPKPSHHRASAPPLVASLRLEHSSAEAGAGPGVDSVAHNRIYETFPHPIVRPFRPCGPHGTSWPRGCAWLPGGRGGALFLPRQADSAGGSCVLLQLGVAE
mmetsp:Transcript_93145/g.249446  ORF Transcript_93145/g.249446 Transcript_93145/m.249446 type:complete len:223 (+) Transcript_93145:872-1540(+)